MLELVHVFKFCFNVTLLELSNFHDPLNWHVLWKKKK